LDGLLNDPLRDKPQSITVQSQCKSRHYTLEHHYLKKEGHMSEYNYGCQMICNDQDVYPAMRDLVENKGMTVKGAARFVHKDSDGQVSPGRAEQVYIRRKPATDVAGDTPSRKQTKRKAKKQLDDVAEAVRTDDISDDDMKHGVETVPDKFRQLRKHILSVNEGLEKWVAGSMKPDTEDDLIAIKGIMASLPYLCRQAALVGVDLAKIHETLERESRVSSPR
jgi:hypothetical protein